MENRDKTREQLLTEINKLKDKIADQEKIKSKRKQAEEEIKQKNKNLVLLMEASQAINASLDADTVNQRIIENATGLLGLDTGAIYLINKEKLTLSATTPPLPPDFPDEFRKAMITDHPYIQKTISSRSYIVLEDTARSALSPAEQSIMEIRSIRSIIYLPLIDGKEVLGVMLLGTQNETRSFSEAEINLYRTFSDQATLNLKNVMLYQNVQSELAKRKKVEKALQIERDNFKNIFKDMEDGVYIVSQQYDIQFVNSILVKEFGLYEGRKCYEYFHDREEFCPWCKNPDVFAGKTVRWEWTSPKNEKTYDLIDTPLKNVDGSISKLEIFRDISERKQMEKNWNMQKKKFHDILEGTNAGTWNWNIQTGELVLNERWAEIMGFSLKELEPIDINTWVNNVHPNDLPYANDLLDKHFNRKLDYYDVEFRQAHKNGTWVWVNARGKVIEWTKDGKPLWMSGTHLDITERKLAERELARAHDIINRSPAVAILWKNEKNWPVEYASKNIIDLFGYTAEEFLSRKVAYDDIIHPDDHERVIKEINTASKNKQSVNFIHKPYRIISKSKEIRWVEDRTSIIRDLKGEITHRQGIVLDITDKISTDKEKAEAYEKIKNYQELFEESVNEIYIFDAKSYKFSEVNRSALNNLGYTQDEIKELSPIDIKPEFNRKDFNQLVRSLKNKKKNKLIFNAIHERKNGTTYPVEVHLRLTKHGVRPLFVAFILDITERLSAEKLSKETENALKNSEYLLRESQKVARLGSYVMDISSNKWDSSKVLDDLFGIDENYNKDISDWLQVIHPEDKAMMQDYFATNVLKNHESFNKEYRIKRINDQQECWVHGTGELELNNDGNPIKMIGTIQDITDRKHAEQELAKYREQLEKTVKQRTADIDNKSKKLEESQRALTFLLEDVNDARVELEQTNKQIILTNKEMESFTYSVSHDLRAPLRAILGFSNKFTDSYGKFVDKEGKRLLKVINDNTKKMGMLIDDLLDFSRMGRSEMRKVKVDIKGLVNETWNEQKNQFADRKIELTIKDLPITNGDRNMLRQVLFNLLSNAAKFTKNKKISKIEVGFEERKSEIIYYVKDNGVGFDMKYKDKLFQVFQRLHSDREFEGTGVGLAIVHRVISRHGGKVWAKSTINKGATIYFSLPK